MLLYKHSVPPRVRSAALLRGTTPVLEYDIMWGLRSEVWGAVDYYLWCTSALFSLTKPVYFQTTWLTRAGCKQELGQLREQQTMATSRLLALRTLLSPRTFPRFNALRQFSASKVLSGKPFYSVTFQTGSDKFSVQVRIMKWWQTGHWQGRHRYTTKYSLLTPSWSWDSNIHFSS